MSTVGAWRVLLGALIASCVGGRAPAHEPAEAATPARADWIARLPGCYALFDHADRPASSSLYGAPDRVRLEIGGRASKLTSRATSDEMEQAGWRVDARTDTVHVVFRRFSGTEFLFALRPRGDTLFGRAVEHWDLGPRSEDAGPAWAVRIPCPD